MHIPVYITLLYVIHSMLRVIELSILLVSEMMST